MANHHYNHHQSSRRLMLVFCFTSVLGIGFVAAFLFVSSSTFSFPGVNRPQIQISNIDPQIIQKGSKHSNDTTDHVDTFDAKHPPILYTYKRKGKARKV